MSEQLTIQNPETTPLISGDRLDLHAGEASGRVPYDKWRELAEAARNAADITLVSPELPPNHEIILSIGVRVMDLRREAVGQPVVAEPTKDQYALAA